MMVIIWFTRIDGLDHVDRFVYWYACVSLVTAECLINYCLRSCDHLRSLMQFGYDVVVLKVASRKMTRFSVELHENILHCHSCVT